MKTLLKTLLKTTFAGAPLLIALGFLISNTAGATAMGDLTCAGPGRVTSVFSSTPMFRTITAVIHDDGTATSTITVDVGADPVSYTGVLSLDGSKSLDTVAAGSGDIAHIRAMLMGPDLGLTVQFTDASGHLQGEAVAESMTCH